MFSILEYGCVVSLYDSYRYNEEQHQTVPAIQAVVVVVVVDPSRQSRARARTIARVRSFFSESTASSLRQIRPISWLDITGVDWFLQECG